LHVLAAIPNGLILERIEDDWAGRAQTVVPHPLQENGFLKVPDAPGLGVDIDEAFVKAHPSECNVSIPGAAKNGAYAEGTYDEQVYVQTRLKRGVYFPKG
jgi:galactonate dehydratase